jgi:hypothetical protein
MGIVTCRQMPGAAAIAAVAMLHFVSWEAAGAGLSLPTKRATFAPAFVPGATVPKWSGPYLISWKSVTPVDDRADNLVLYRRDGRIAASVRIWFPDAYRVQIRDASASRTGRAAVVGITYNNAGVVVGFLALISSTGLVESVVRTAPFEGRAIAFGPDDTVWSFGYQLGSGRMLKTAPDHSMIQRYGAGGKLIAEALPYSMWRECGQHPSSGKPQLAVFSDRVNVVSGACREWIELSPAGELMARRPLPMVTVTDASDRQTGEDTQHLVRSAITSTNQLYAHFLGSSQPGLLRWVPEQSSWDRVDLASAGEPMPQFFGLLGIDGDELVYYGGQGLVFWTKVIE